jgi:nickel-dependent lactate racemase
MRSAIASSGMYQTYEESSMDRTQTVSLRQMPWYGDTEFDIAFPDSWDVSVCRMRGAEARPLEDTEIRQAFASPIGTETIRELARDKREVVIIFDDMSRPTPVADLVPYVLEELAAAGIPDDNIRFIGAPGSHGTMNAIDFRKKLGDEVVGRFLVFNHNPYENCTYLGKTSRGTPVEINREVMSCDLKLGIGCIVPHPLNGFGGGGKIILPGVASLETIHVNHSTFAPSPLCGIGECHNNPFKQDVDETARMAGLDVKIDAILNLKREIAALFVGDPTREHDQGVKVARQHFATEIVGDNDIVVANCYAKANEIILAPLIASATLAEKGGDMVIIYNTPQGPRRERLVSSKSLASENQPADRHVGLSGESRPRLRGAVPVNQPGQELGRSDNRAGAQLWFPGEGGRHPRCHRAVLSRCRCRQTGGLTRL